MSYRFERDRLSLFEYAKIVGEKIRGRIHRKKVASPTEHVLEGFPREVQKREVGGFVETEIALSEHKDSPRILMLDLTNTFVTFKQSVRQGRQSFENVAHALLPLGQVEGRFFVGSPFDTRYRGNTSDGKRNYGPHNFTDRFPGLDEDLNTAFSGGIALVDNKIKLGDRAFLVENAQRGNPIAQLTYSWTSENASQLMNHSWTHQNVDQPIGFSQFNWSWYFQDSEKTLFLCIKGIRSPHNQISLHTINQINNFLSEGKPWKAALSDFGLGGGYVIRTNKGGRFSSYPDPRILHATPLHLFVEPLPPAAFE